MSDGDSLAVAYVDIRARLDKLEKDFDKAKDTANKVSGTMADGFQRMNRSFVAFGRGLNTLTVGVFAALGIDVLTDMWRRNLDLIASFQTLSRNIGVSTDFIQELRYASVQLQLNFDRVAIAMRKTAQRAAEARMGYGEAVDMVRDLNLELEDSQGNLKSAEQLFRDVLKVLAETNSVAEKHRIAMKFFEEEGVVVAAIADDFEKFRKEAHALGVVIDQRVVVAAENVKKRLDALYMTVTARLGPAIVDLAPAFVGFAEAMAKAADWAGKIFQRFQDMENLSARGLEHRISVAKEEMEDLRSIYDNQLRMAIAAGRIIQAGDFLIPQNPSGDADIQRLSKRSQKMQELSNEIAEMTDRLKKLRAIEDMARPDPYGEGGQTARITDIYRQQEEALSRNVDQLMRQSRALGVSEEMYRRVAAATEAENLAQELSIRFTDSQAIAIAGLIQKRAELLDSIQDQKDAYAEARREAERLRKQQEDAVASMEDLSEDTADSFSSSMSRMIADADFSFKKMAELFRTEFVARVIQTQIFDRLFAAFQRGINAGRGAVPSLQELGPTPALPSPIPSPVGISGVTASAAGTMNLGGTISQSVEVFNYSGQQASTTRSADGKSVRVVIGQEAAQDVLSGGSLDRAIRSRYNLTPGSRR